MIAIKKELRRKTYGTFLHYGKAIVVQLLPGDVISLRLHGQRESSAVYVNIGDLYYELVRRRVAARRAEKKKQRAERRKNERRH